MANLTLLHLSDIHLGAPGQEAAQERIAERGIPKALEPIPITIPMLY